MEVSCAPIPLPRGNNGTPHHHYYSSPDSKNYLSQASGSNNFSNSVVNNTDFRASGSHNHMYASPVIHPGALITPSSQNGGTSGVHNSGFSHSTHEPFSPGYIHDHHHHEYYTDTRNLNHSSNSNTTVSCTSGNSTSANLGIGSNKPEKTHNNNNSIVFSDTTKINEIKVIETTDTGPTKKPKSFTIGNPNQEFLPICDALFNVISLAAYFCDIAFDILTAYTWYKKGISQTNALNENPEFPDFSLETDNEFYVQTNFMQWSLLAIICIVVSTLLSQTLSYKWYKESETRGQMGMDGSEIPGPPPPCSNSILMALHISLCGVLWRYFKLFIPVDLRFVKNEVRDLCLLRLVHAFCEAAPMLLIQLYLIWLTPGPEFVTDFTIVSTTLSLFSVCWAFASFTKHIRKQNVHKLVLTWLGVVCQFLWRLGTLTSRVVALSVYATVYSYWLFLVLVLHWFSMLMWLISPKNIFHGEKMSTARKTGYATLIAVVYTFGYINVQEHNSKDVIMTYYVTLFLENSLLLAVSLIALNGTGIWFLQLSIYLTFIPFAIGLGFMCIYYRYCHVKRLSYVYDATSNCENPCSTLSRGAGPEHSSGSLSPSSSSNNGSSSTERGPKCFEGRVMRNKLTHSKPLVKTRNDKPYRKNNALDQSEKYGNQLPNNMTGHGHHIHHPNVPGVFNCRFHPAMKRKKKKPTSFIPPPVIHSTKSEENDTNNSKLDHVENHDKSTFPSSVTPNNLRPNNEPASSNTPNYPSGNIRMATKMANPFWKRPLSITLGSETEGSVGSRVDIQQKLQEKKQQQLQELRVIEEEIKQGKLKRPHVSPEPISVQQPIPCEKKQPWFQSGQNSTTEQQTRHTGAFVMPGNDFNELLLDPQYLVYASIGGGGNNNCPGFYASPEWPANYYNEPVYHNDLNDEASYDDAEHFYTGDLRENEFYKSYRGVHSDMEDNEMSLPRSYTLPKLKRKSRKVVKTENFVPSTNSSDGDVDSGEEGPDIYSQVKPYPLPSVQPVHNLPSTSTRSKNTASARRKKLHETKL